jgi:hypothetical protein
MQTFINTRKHNQTGRCGRSQRLTQICSAKPMPKPDAKYVPAAEQPMQCLRSDGRFPGAAALKTSSKRDSATRPQQQTADRSAQTLQTKERCNAGQPENLTKTKQDSKELERRQQINSNPEHAVPQRNRRSSRQCTQHNQTLTDKSTLQPTYAYTLLV